MINLDTVATQFTGTPTQVVCSSDRSHNWDGGVAGFVLMVNGVPQHIVRLPNSECVRLEKSQTDNAIDPSDMLIFTHELLHTEGYINECDTELLATRNEWSLLKLFKLPKWRAKVYLDGIKEADSEMFAQYHTGCTIG